MRPSEKVNATQHVKKSVAKYRRIGEKTSRKKSQCPQVSRNVAHNGNVGLRPRENMPAGCQRSHISQGCYVLSLRGVITTKPSRRKQDCFVADAPRNDTFSRERKALPIYRGYVPAALSQRGSGAKCALHKTNLDRSQKQGCLSRILSYRRVIALFERTDPTPDGVSLRMEPCQG